MVDVVDPELLEGGVGGRGGDERSSEGNGETHFACGESGNRCLRGVELGTSKDGPKTNAYMFDRMFRNKPITSEVTVGSPVKCLQVLDVQPDVVQFYWRRR